jgi:Icc-related predicted phosphoesterase
MEVDGVMFFGLGYNHSEAIIPKGTDIVITHEPPVMIQDESAGIHWGNAPLRNRIFEIKPRYHLFGHAHDGYGIIKQNGITFSNAALLNDRLQLVRKPRLFNLDL